MRIWNRGRLKIKSGAVDISLEHVRRTIQSGRMQLDATDGQIESLKARLEGTRKDLQGWVEAQGILQSASKAVQTAVHAQIADVVTTCLQTVYDDSLSFHIDFETKRGKTEARLYFRKGGNEVDPLEAGGLGWIEVASFALRMAVLKLHSPPVAQVIVADEPFRMLDSDAKPRMAELLVKLSEQMQVQFILATHDKEFMVGKVIKL